ncbi:MAG: hypothetical protein ACOYU4_06530 [Thermodesulfobacteriota bacterium]
MPDYFSPNMDILLKKNRSLARSVRDTAPDDSFEILRTKSGHFTVGQHAKNGTYRFIHSRVNPEREARAWVDCQNLSERTIVILGLGLTYHVLALFKRRKDWQQLYLIEADESLFRLALEVSDLSDIIGSTAIRLLVGSDLRAIEQILPHDLQNPFSYHIFLPATSLHSEFYQPVIRALEKHLYGIRLNGDDGRGENLSLAKGVQRLFDEMISQ